MNLIKYIRKANRAVAKGNIYRRKKYGKPDTFEESAIKAKKRYAWQCENFRPKSRSMFENEKQMELCDEYKSHFQYWKCWTGGRYQLQENPSPKPDAEPGSTCKSCPVTGKWFPL